MPPMLSAFLQNPQRVRFEGQDPAESIILLLRAHPITTVKWFIAALFFALLPFIFFRNLGFFGFSPTSPDVLRFSRIFITVWELVIIGFVMEQFLIYYFNVYVVTNMRIIDISFNNLLSKKVSEARLREIEDVSLTQNGLLRSIFNYGDVSVQTAGAAQEFRFYAVPRPADVVDTIEGLLPKTGGE